MNRFDICVVAIENVKAALARKDKPCWFCGASLQNAEAMLARSLPDLATVPMPGESESPHTLIAVKCRSCGHCLLFAEKVE